MLEELTILSFSKFGITANFSKRHLPHDFVLKQYAIKPELPQKMKKYSQEVYVEPTGGLGVIFIENESQIVRKFLLDKQIKINPDIWFCISAFEEVFSYNIFTSTKKQEKNDDIEYVASAYRPTAQVKKLVLALYQDKGLDYNELPHKRDFWQLIYMDKGNMTCVVDGVEHTLNQGDYIFILPGQKQSQRALEARAFSFLTLVFDIDFQPANFFSNKVFKINSTTQRVIKSIINEYRLEDKYFYDIISSYIPILLNEVCREQGSNQAIKTAAPTSFARNSMNTLANNCLRIIDENISGDLTLPTLSRFLHVSPSYLSKVFKEELGLNISEYIREYRMEKSKEFIRLGDYSMSEIADMLGFCSINYFSAQFKEKYGISPREYSKATLQD